MMIKKKQNLIEIIILFALLLLITPNFYHSYDMSFFLKWAIQIHKFGISSTYDIDNNHPPIFQYCMYFFDLINGTTENIIKNINYLKVFSLIFLIVPIIFILFYKNFIDYKRKYHFMLLLNIAYIYDTLVWGQVDSIYTCFSFLSIVLAFDFPIIASLTFVISLNTKLMSIESMAVFLLLILINIKNLKTIFKIILFSILLQTIIVLPFIINGKISSVLKLITGAVDYWPYVSMNAYNIWYLITNINPFETEDSKEFFILTYKQTGLILFVIFNLIILIPAFIKSLKAFITKEKANIEFKELIFLTLGLNTICFFFFNTQMHERYSYSAILFFFTYGIFYKKFDLYILTSIAAFLNMERVLKYYRIDHNYFFFQPKFVAVIYLLILILGIYRLYNNYKLTEDLKYIKFKI